MRMFGTNAMLGMVALAAAVQVKPLSAEEREQFSKRRAQEREEAEIMRQQQEHSCGHFGKPVEYYRKRNVPKKLRVKP